MISDERMQTFVDSFDTGHTPFLEELYDSCIAENIPVIRRDVQAFLKTMIRIRRPENILEIGTAAGFSAILMAEYSDPGCLITTIENYEKRIAMAEKNISEAGYESKISLMKGDADGILDILRSPFDFIFMDAAKGQYINFLPKVKKLMKPGSILISDNILQNGELLESHYLVERRDRTIYKRMREYLYELKHDPCFETSILTIGDGVALSVMRDDK